MPAEWGRAEGVASVGVSSSTGRARSKWPAVVIAFAIGAVATLTVHRVIQARHAAALAEWKLDPISRSDWTRTDGTLVSVSSISNLSHARRRVLHRLRRFLYYNHSHWLMVGTDAAFAIAYGQERHRSRTFMSGYSGTRFFEMVCTGGFWQSEIRAFPGSSMLPLLQCTTPLRVGRPVGRLHIAGAGTVPMPAGWFTLGEMVGMAPGNNMSVRRSRSGPHMVVLAPNFNYPDGNLGPDRKVVVGVPLANAVVRDGPNAALMGCVFMTAQGTVLLETRSALRLTSLASGRATLARDPTVLRKAAKAMVMQLQTPSPTQLSALMALLHGIPGWRPPQALPWRPTYIHIALDRLNDGLQRFTSDDSRGSVFHQ